MIIYLGQLKYILCAFIENAFNVQYTICRLGGLIEKFKSIISKYMHS